MEQNAIKPYNFHDYFIMLIMISMIVGTAQIGLFGFAFIAGLLCLPAAVKEIHISFKQKAQPIIVFMILFLLYAIISVLWSPQHEYLLREIWLLFWHIILFIGLFHHARYANTPQTAFLHGLRILICLTFIIATWEITTDSHLSGIGNFNEGAEIATANGSEHRIFAAVTYRNLNTYVVLLCMSLPFLVYGLFILRRKWLSLIAVIGSILILIINSSRGGLMCLMVDIIVFLLIYRKISFPNKKLITIIGIIAIALFTLQYGLIIAEQAIGRMAAYGKENIMSDAGRWDVWRMGIEFCIKSWGFGWGIGSMQPMYASTGFWLHYSHNLVIEFLMQYGIWLFIPLGIILMKRWIDLIQAEHMPTKMLGLMLLTSFVPLAIIDDTYLTRPFLWIWLFMQFSITANTNNINYQS